MTSDHVLLGSHIRLFHTLYFVTLNASCSSPKPFCSCYFIPFVKISSAWPTTILTTLSNLQSFCLRLRSTRVTGVHYHTWLYYIRLFNLLASICSSCATPSEFSQTSSQQRQDHVYKNSLGGWRWLHQIPTSTEITSICH